MVGAGDGGVLTKDTRCAKRLVKRKYKKSTFGSVVGKLHLVGVKCPSFSLRVTNLGYRYKWVPSPQFPEIPISTGSTSV